MSILLVRSTASHAINNGGELGSSWKFGPDRQYLATDNRDMKLLSTRTWIFDVDTDCTIPRKDIVVRLAPYRSQWYMISIPAGMQGLRTLKRHEA